MSSFKGIDVQSKEAKQLQASLQTQLAARGYSTDDDPVMAEYIVVMLANQKTQEQINAELLDLIGDDYKPDLTEWLWTEADRLINGIQSSAPESAVAGPSSPSVLPDASSRRSRSPVQRQERRRSRSPPPPYSTAASHGSDRAARDYDQQQAGESMNGRAFWQKRAEDKRRQPPPRAQRELFNTAFAQATDSYRPTADQNPPPVSVSIFGRASVPDPRAAEFVPQQEAVAPQSSAAESIFSRIDPMVPNNTLPPATSSAAVVTDEFPSVPSESTPCIWKLKCTNPMCAYSHASPANAGPNGDENAIITTTSACMYGAKCTNKSCTRSHVSPSIAFLDRKAVLAVSNAFGGSKLAHSSEACKYQKACSNPSCAYKHYDDNGNVVPGPALVALSNGSAMNTSKAEDDMQDDDTMITTTADKAGLLDKALSNAPSSRPCKFGSSCTRPGCFFSHPARTSGATPCHFGLGCTRVGCYYSHPPGHSLSSAPRQTSDRLSVFSTSDQDMERIIPTTSVPLVAE